eukprot:GHUV01053683.1.p1 GENE.GHUV01053683.1~~GHUV01053683.1.p1  ORF type:complete len:120 (-),score=12.31 GHUV01053683.1:764-1123(-)
MHACMHGMAAHMPIRSCSVSQSKAYINSCIGQQSDSLRADIPWLVTWLRLHRKHPAMFQLNSATNTHWLPQTPSLSAITQQVQSAGATEQLLPQDFAAAACWCILGSAAAALPWVVAPY